MTPRILHTITLAKFSDGLVREIKVEQNLNTANVMEVPLVGLVWSDEFQPIHSTEFLVASPEVLIKEVSKLLNVSAEDIISHSRKRELAYARHLFIYLARAKTLLSWKSIGNYLGGRDHSSAIHGCDVIRDLLNHSPTVREDVDRLKRNLLKYPDANQIPKSRPKKIIEMKHKRIPPAADNEVSGILKQIGDLKEKYAVKDEPIKRVKW